MNTPDFHIEPARCRHCTHSWHALPCGSCFCETACLAGTLIVPPNITLGED